jgi:hypothetical protein
VLRHQLSAFGSLRRETFTRLYTSLTPQTSLFTPILRGLVYDSDDLITVRSKESVVDLVVLAAVVGFGLLSLVLIACCRLLEGR